MKIQERMKNSEALVQSVHQHFI